MPGDSFSVVCENVESEVEWLLNRLDLTSMADTQATLAIMANTQAKRKLHLLRSSSRFVSCFLLCPIVCLYAFSSLLSIFSDLY